MSTQKYQLFFLFFAVSAMAHVTFIMCKDSKNDVKQDFFKERKQFESLQSAIEEVDQPFNLITKQFEHFNTIRFVTQQSEKNVTISINPISIQADALNIVPKHKALSENAEIDFLEIAIPISDYKLTLIVYPEAVKIVGQQEKKEEIEREGYYACKIDQGSTSRRILLPAKVDLKQTIDSTWEDGILTLTFAKSEVPSKIIIKKIDK